MSASRLELLRDATAELNMEQRREFEDYFIGAISINVSDDVWKSAIAAAQRCYASSGRRDAERDAEKSGGAQ